MDFATNFEAADHVYWIHVWLSCLSSIFHVHVELPMEQVFCRCWEKFQHFFENHLREQCFLNLSALTKAPGSTYFVLKFPPQDSRFFQNWKTFLNSVQTKFSCDSVQLITFSAELWYPRKCDPDRILNFWILWLPPKEYWEHDWTLPLHLSVRWMRVSKQEVAHDN